MYFLIQFITIDNSTYKHRIYYSAYRSGSTTAGISEKKDNVKRIKF